MIPEEDQKELHLLASSLLRGMARKYYDNLKEKVDNFDEFKSIMDKRFGETKADKPEIYRQFLNKLQKDDEDTLSFVEDMIRLGERTELDEKMITQTIIGNMRENKILYRLHIKNEYTYDNLRNLINIIEDEKKVDPFEYKNEENKVLELQKELENLSLMVKQQNSPRPYMNVRCNNCDKAGHLQKNCRFNSNNSNNAKIHEEKPNRSNKIIKRIESLMNIELNGSVKEFTEKITTPTENLKLLLKGTPENFCIRKTLERNQLIAIEVVKSLTKKDVNRVHNQDDNSDIVRCEIKINGQVFESVIDSGANNSVISEETAKKLNLPICFKNKS